MIHSNKREFLQCVREGYLSPEEIRNEHKRYDLSDDEMAECMEIAAIREVEEVPHSRTFNRIYDILPEDSWLRAYMKHFERSEAHSLFIAFCGLALLGNALGRRMCLPFSGSIVYPLINIFLMSPAGVARRGEAVKPTIRIAKAAYLTVMQNRFTTEALLSLLRDDPHLFIVAEEASTLFGSKDYQSGIAQTLCQVLDCSDDEFTTKKEGKVSVENITASGIFSSAPSWFRTMPQEVLTGGLLSRCLIIYVTTRDHTEYFPWKLEINPLLGEQKLGKSLAGLAKKAPKGFCRSTSGFDRLWRRVRDDCDRSAIEAHGKMSSWYARKPTHVLKVCMVLSAHQEEPLLNEDMLDRSLALIHIAEAHMSQAYKQIGLDRHNQKLEIIMGELEKVGGYYRHYLLYRKVGDAFKDSKDFLDTVERGLHLGWIEKKRERGVKTGVHYRSLRRLQ